MCNYDLALAKQFIKLANRIKISFACDTFIIAKLIGDKMVWTCFFCYDVIIILPSKAKYKILGLETFKNKQ